ncbi:DUF6415 family natural product biosynthesis protein [Streptomyces sp. SPB074]|uniref:DUF6415 family natural product biosynthesis protein n=1 Tax=Streptomyces sp. (strain SPB074) TaxID=465543 RepID=UPI00017F1654|nr:DUF6415 family natural product biosynthesis protein [Streptomyces sp. SPB074]EDY46160.1 proline-rich protein HaeIII subfamily 1 [Streptomyces sp. SPB074]
MHTSKHTILHDPDALIEAQLPPHRAPYESLVNAVLAWTDNNPLEARDYEQISLQLNAHARALATRIQHAAHPLPEDNGPREPAHLVLDEAHTLLAAPIKGTAHCVQNRARLIRALYERLDRLEAAGPPTV